MLTTEAIERAVELYEGGATESAVAEATGISGEEASAVVDALSLGKTDRMYRDQALASAFGNGSPEAMRSGRGLIGDSAGVIPQLASNDSPTGKKADVLLRLLRRRVFTGRRHNSLEPQIRDHVPIVLIRVRRIDRKQGKLRQVEVHEFHHLAALCIGHAVERVIAVGNRVLERSYEISFRRFRSLDILTRICFASGLRAKRVGGVSHMANELAKTANIRCRFEGVVFFRHFLRRTKCRVAYKRVEPSFARRNRIRWRRCRRLRLLLPEESNGNRRQCSKHKTQSFGHETPP